MKYILFVGDGIADRNIEKLGGKTPLQFLQLENASKLTGSGEYGLAETIPDGIVPGTDTAFFTILGYDIYTEFTGRSPLEAAGMGIVLDNDDTAFRCNLCAISCDEFENATMLSHSGGQIGAEEGKEIMEWLLLKPEMQDELRAMNMRIFTGTSFRHVAAIKEASMQSSFQKDLRTEPPHDIVGQKMVQYLPKGFYSEELTRFMKLSYSFLPHHPINVQRSKQGLLPANCLWLWAQGKKPVLQSFTQKFGVKGCCISAVPLIRGLGAICGLDYISVEGATGELDTNYRGKAQAAVDALREGYDFAIVHLEAPDECSHSGNLDEKLLAMQNMDGMIGHILDGMEACREPFRMLFMSDHATPAELRIHTSEPVPYCIYDSSRSGSKQLNFDERSLDTGIITPGKLLMEELLSDHA